MYFGYVIACYNVQRFAIVSFFWPHVAYICRSDGQVDRTSASDMVDSVLIPELGQAEDFRKFHSQLSCLAFSIKRDSVEKKPIRSLFVSLGKVLNGIPPALSVRQPATTLIKQIHSFIHFCFISAFQKMLWCLMR